MSALELPENFGNYTLGEGFAEIVPADAISWLPQTSGWVFIATLLSLTVAYKAYKRSVRWYKRRYRREAIAQLNALLKNPSSVTLIKLNELLKRAALAGFSRAEVAALSGEQWVSFLNAQCESPVFHKLHAQLLSEAIYQQNHTKVDAIEALALACRNWLENHTSPLDV